MCPVRQSYAALALALTRPAWAGHRKPQLLSLYNDAY